MERTRRSQNRKKQKHGQCGRRIISLAATIRQQNREEISSDILGSYTGTDAAGKRPEQDADDL